MKLGLKVARVVNSIPRFCVLFATSIITIAYPPEKALCSDFLEWIYGVLADQQTLRNASATIRARSLRNEGDWPCALIRLRRAEWIGVTGCVCGFTSIRFVNAIVCIAD